VLGRTQLKKLDNWNHKRSVNYTTFRAQNIGKPWCVELPTSVGNSAMTLPFHCASQEIATNVKTFLNSLGIETRPFLVGNLLLQPFMKKYKSLIKLPNSEKMHTHSFYIGNNHFVTPTDIKNLSEQLDRCTF